jgi:hypothetical protein
MSFLVKYSLKRNYEYEGFYKLIFKNIIMKNIEKIESFCNEENKLVIC